MLLESSMWCPIIGFQSLMVVGFMGTGCVVGFVEVEFEIVHVPTNIVCLDKVLITNRDWIFATLPALVGLRSLGPRNGMP